MINYELTKWFVKTSKHIDLFSANESLTQIQNLIITTNFSVQNLNSIEYIRRLQEKWMKIKNDFQ